MLHAILPAKLRKERTPAVEFEPIPVPCLRDLSPGQYAYTVPWAMWVDASGRCWLHGWHSAHRNPGGTVQLRVEYWPDGLRVTTPPDAQWETRDRAPEVGDLPVVNVKIAR